MMYKVGKSGVDIGNVMLYVSKNYILRVLYVKTIYIYVHSIFFYKLYGGR